MLRASRRASYASEWGATLKETLPPTVEAQIESKQRELDECVTSDSGGWAAAVSLTIHSLDRTGACALFACVLQSQGKGRVRWFRDYVYGVRCVCARRSCGVCGITPTVYATGFAHRACLRHTIALAGMGQTLERFGVSTHGKRRMDDLMAQPKER